MKLSKNLLMLIVLVPLMLNGCTSMLLVKSSWNNNQTVVDGRDTDWTDTMFYIPDAQVTAGVRNDTSNMYLILKATDRQQAFQIMGLGLTVWFDPSGGTSQKFGIHFPLGGHQSGERVRPTETSNPDETQDQNPSFMDMTPNQLEILGVNENGPVRLTIADAKGIELQMNRGPNGLIYELKVPLHKSAEHPYAINAKGKSIGVEFEGGKFESREKNGSSGRTRGEGGETGPGGGEGGGEGMPPSGSGGGGMRGGRGRNFGSEGGQRQQPKQIDFWLKVQLANQTTGSSD